MKSAIAFAAISAATISLQGCGDSGTTTVTPAPCSYDSDAVWTCPATLSTTFQDIHDGDSKNVTLENGVLTISGGGMGSPWSTSLNLDPSTCMGSVNFTVPNKPSPPDTNLTLTLLSSFASESSCSSPSNYVLSFSNPGDTNFVPLNQWVESSGSSTSGTNYTCFREDQMSTSKFYADMGDGDQKVVTTDCTGPGDTCAVTITPKGGTDVWTVSAELDKATCEGMVDFNVPGKPNPPSEPLKATVRISRWFNQKVMVEVDEMPAEYFIEFSGSDGSLLNQWVELGNPAILPTGFPTTTGGPTTAGPATTAGPNVTTMVPTSMAPMVTTSTVVAPTTTMAPMEPTTTTVTTTTTPPGIIVA